jgi:hypothetical protein
MARSSAAFRWVELTVVVVALASCGAQQGLLRPERLDVEANCPHLMVDAVDQFGGASGARPPSDLVFLFSNRSRTDTLQIDVAHMVLRDSGEDLPIWSSCSVIDVRPLEVRQCRVFWSKGTQRFLSPGAVFRFPVQCDEAMDTVRCTWR